MPTKPPSPCTCTCSCCPNLTRRGSRRPENAYNRARGSAVRRGYGHQWRKTRRVVVRLGRGSRQECGAPDARQVAQVVDRGADGSDDPLNLGATRTPATRTR